MTYHLGGLGDTNFASVVPNYCSVAKPKPGCSPIAGVAKPMDVATLDLFKELQRQLNRVAQAKGFTKIDVDGRIGPGSVKLYQKAFGSSTTSDGLATAAASVQQSAKSIADLASVPATVPGPTIPLSPPSTANPDGTVADPPGVGILALIPGLAAMLPGGNLGFLVAIGAVAGGAYFLSKKKGKGSGGGRAKRKGRRTRIRARKRARARTIRRRGRGRRR